ncbi:hypothetical protein [Autumnicola musiva]|uniref:Uncharacterized protein n=1 Tax=Autumnicola musiva TaxID=3075589 RepID=A0ABU3D5W3_9FLAO|nr:hypothetical protein [Zunongwangia sp. F117]MDT0676920.1 hypothetical protein [Zunongwangia sp. F117]
MKKAIVFLMLTVLFTSAQSQIIELEETEVKLNSVPLISNVNSKTNEFIIKEGYTSQFHENALEFVKKNFDVQEFIENSRHNNSTSYEVAFRSPKGFLQATYNEEGEMVNSYQKFKDIALPYEIRNRIYPDFRGWTITKNSFVARGKMDKIDKSFYKIKLERGNEKERIKLSTANTSHTGLVSN